AQQLAMRDERNTDVALHAELAHETEVEVVLRQLGELLVADLGGELAATSTEDERRALHGLGILGIPACELERQLDLPRVDVFDRERVQASVLDDVDAGPVRDPRHGEAPRPRRRSS